MSYKLKEVKNMYEFVGTKEVELQEYDFGIVFPEFCFVWKEGKKINRKIIREMLKLKDEVEKEDKKRLKSKEEKNK